MLFDKEEMQRRYVEENKYVPPGLLSREETMEILSDIYHQLATISKQCRLSRGDRIYYDVRGILGSCMDEIQKLNDDIYNDEG